MHDTVKPSSAKHSFSAYPRHGTPGHAAPKTPLTRLPCPVLRKTVTWRASFSTGPGPDGLKQTFIQQQK
jgi:hypothetical protein